MCVCVWVSHFCVARFLFCTQIYTYMYIYTATILANETSTTKITTALWMNVWIKKKDEEEKEMVQKKKKTKRKAANGNVFQQ